MTQIEQQKAAKEFSEYWKDKGDEKQHSQSFWTALLRDVFGIEQTAKYIDFEKRVKINGTKYIDGYISQTHVAIEQKGIKIDLDKKELQSDKTELSPYEQAKRYDDNLPHSEKCRWIVVCNFKEFRIYDMEKEEPEKHFETLLLKDLEKEYYRLQFLVDKKNENIRKEEEISIQAGKLVGKLYDALIKQYINPDEKSLRSLNILCVRIVFCLYAEDAGLFSTRTAFEDYIKSFAIENLRDGVIKLFKGLDTKIEERDKYDTKLQSFPYVNGGLFSDEQIEIPNFTQEIVDVIVNDCAPFNWSEISPTIFGAVFESTLNPDTRRKGGMHYTSVENIHKVIDPLFMNELNDEFEKISKTNATKTRNEKLLAFQKKLGSLKFLDPACGSGNFLTETYLSLRRLENECIKIRLGKQQTALDIMGDDFAIQVQINQFYGIEINDFAVTVAKTALWIAESQMMEETARILNRNLDFLPLTTNAFIIEGNALRMDWSTLAEEKQSKYLFADKLNVYKIDKDLGGLEFHSPEIEFGKHYKELNVVTKEVEEKKFPETEIKEHIVYDYIIGNPPFVGYTFQTDRQKEDLSIVNNKMGKNIDYVVGWYIKASFMIKNTKTKCAFVSTNSITQGEQVAEVWKPLFDTCNIQFDFAYRTFIWNSESTQKAHVHCVILGFSDKNSNQKEKIIFDEKGNKQNVKNVNPYLLDAPTIFIEKRKIPLCDVSKINKGSQPTDGGNLIMSPEEYEDFIIKEPSSKKFIHEFLGAEEFINGKKRYCLWLIDASPAEMRKMPLVMKRVEAVKKMRLASSKEATRNWAAYPYLFTENRQPENGNYLLIPRVSSERRKYIPIGYVSSDIIASDAVQLVPNATLYEFGILTSSIHNAWMRVVCGRLKSDYRYSNDLVYNNFPWCTATEELHKKIEQTAQIILDVRKNYQNSTFADLYDETFMPVDLRKAHEANDKAVMSAYGFDPKMKESEIVAELFKMYEKLANETK